MQTSNTIDAIILNLDCMYHLVTTAGFGLVAFDLIESGLIGSTSFDVADVLLTVTFSFRFSITQEIVLAISPHGGQFVHSLAI